MAKKEWRKIVFAWLKEQDQSLVNNAMIKLDKFTTADCDEMDIELEKAACILKSQEERDIAPLKRETNIISADEKMVDDTVNISMLVSRHHVYQQQGKTITEENEEQVCLRLRQENDFWKIDSFFDDKLKTPFGARIISTSSKFDNFHSASKNTPFNYIPQDAVNYANTYWNSSNPNFRYFPDDDCSNYVSQCLYAGNFPMEFTDRLTTGWWYRRDNPNTREDDTWSYSWAVAISLYGYLDRHPRVERADAAHKLGLGDVIAYNWDGGNRWHHNVIVVDFDNRGEPLVNSHSYNSYHRYWRYTDSSAWTPQTRYAFFHIDRD